MAKRINENELLEKDYTQNESYDYNDVYYDEKHAQPAGKKGYGKKVWSFFRPIVIFVVSLVVVVFGIRYIVNSAVEKYFSPVDINDSTPIEITIPKGASLSTISEILYENDLVRNKTVFKFYTDFTDMGSRLKSGTYQLSKDMSFDDIIYALRKGMNTSPTNTVTLFEGLTAENYIPIFVEGDIFADGEEYLRICKTADGVSIANDALKSVVANDNASPQKRKYVLEGYLFPDTYEFYRGADPADVISKQLARFNEIYSSAYWQREDELGMSTDEIITLASIIEKEGQEHDFKKISAVLHNRLDRDMPLQCDTTLAYALDIKDRINLTDSELEAASPYNTHLNTGLPIGPICNPSKAAIEAALYPDEDFIDEGYLYFTLTNPELDENGKLYLAYSKTFEEHQAIVDQYKPLWDAYDARMRASGS